MRAHARAKLNQKFMNTLMDMGFTRNRAELALLETSNGGVEVAIEWLLQAEADQSKELQVRSWPLLCFDPAVWSWRSAVVQRSVVAFRRRTPHTAHRAFVLAVATG